MDPVDVKSDIPLQDELLSKIISQFIPLCQWSRSLEYVSKQFQRCVLIAYGGMKSVNCRKLFSLITDVPNGESVREKWDDYVRLNNILEKLLTVCTNLREIAGVEFVTINMQRISVPWDILSQFDKLQSISLSCIMNIPFRPFADFVENSKSLKILDIFRCEFDSCGTLNVGSLSVVHFRYPMNMAPNIRLENLTEKLTTLTMHSFEETFKNARDPMNNCSNLEYLSVFLITANDYEIFFSLLPNLCKLSSLCIHCDCEHPIKWKDFKSQFIGGLNLLKNQLQHIELHDVNINESTQRFLLTQCLKLQSFVVDWRSSNVLSASAVKNLPRLSANLKKLHFSDPRARTLNFLLPKLVNLTNFTDLTVRGNVNSKDWEWQSVCYLVNLQNLRLDGGFVGDNLLQTWDNENGEMFEKLVSLTLRYCSRISDTGAILVAKKARNLKVLDLHMSRIGEKTISVLADVAKKLTEADFFQMSPLLFDDEVLIDLIKKATFLKKIRFSTQLAEKIREKEKFLLLVENVDI